MRHDIGLPVIVAATVLIGSLVAADDAATPKSDVTKESPAASATAPTGDKSNRAAPPEKWDSRVLDTFFPDARKVLVGDRPQYSAAKGGPGGAVQMVAMLKGLFPGRSSFRPTRCKMKLSRKTQRLPRR